MEGSGKRRRFDAAFKAEAVRLVTQVVLPSQVARQLGGTPSALPSGKADAAARHT